jgi:transcriptional regulator with XRE-family HTH domain
MTPEQSRAARAWLNWSQADLAQRAQVSLSTVRDFEKGRHNPIPTTLAAMRRALEDGGVRLLFRQGVAVGIVRSDADHGPFDRS